MDNIDINANNRFININMTGKRDWCTFFLVRWMTKKHPTNELPDVLMSKLYLGMNTCLAF